MRYQYHSLMWLAAVIAVSPVVHAESERLSVAQCVAAHEASQKLRLERKLFESRDVLGRCSQMECPELIRKDCTRWISEVEIAVPSIILRATGDEGDLVDVMVTMDGKVITKTLDGANIDVTPGPHTLVFEAPGYPKKEVRIVVSEGVKNRFVTATLRRPRQPGEEKANPNPPKPEPRPIPTYRPIPITTWVFGGLTIASAGVGAVMGVRALMLKSDKNKPVSEGGCAPNCSASEKSQVSTSALVADVLYGVAGASALVALVTYLVRPEVPFEESPAARVSLHVGPTGGFLGYRGNF